MQLSAYIQIYDYHLLESTYEDYLSQIEVLSDHYGKANIPFKHILSPQEWEEKADEYQRLTQKFLITENTSFFVNVSDLHVLLRDEGGSMSVDDTMEKKKLAIDEFIADNKELIDFLLKNALSFNLDFGLVQSRFG